MLNTKRTMALMVVAGICTSMAVGATLTFQNGLNGYSGTADTYLNGSVNWLQYHNYGASPTLMVVGAPLADGGQRSAALIRFDNLFGAGANQIPAAGAAINSATLMLYCTGLGPDGLTSWINTFFMFTPWIEGNKNDDYATGGEVTFYCAGWEDNGGHITAYWGNRSQIELGPQAGIDYDGSMNAWTQIDNITPGVWVGINITAYMQLWQSGTANRGVYITDTSTFWKGAIFASSNGDAAYRPKLVVDYTYTPQPVSVQATVTLGDYTAADHSLIGARFEFRPVGGGASTTRLALPDTNGVYQLSGIAQGSYSVAVKTYAHLQKVIPGVTVWSDPTVLDPVTLVGGDLDGSNEVSSSDLSIVLMNMDQPGDN